MIAWSEIIIRLTLAAFLGALVGLERERKDWAAGLRTHMMVCVGSSLVMLVSTYGFEDILGTHNVVLDPSRIAAQVISGIGFIGAGTILFLRQGIVRGLTTASGLWTVAAIGLATGGGMYFAASIATLLALCILWLMQPFEKKIGNRFRRRSLKIVVTGDNATGTLEKILHLTISESSNCLIEKTDSGDLSVSVEMKSLQGAGQAALISALQAMPGVKEVGFQR
ncbi:MgtC/SapB family protein [Pinibacter aurantiacus]|uniref:MgtC/SapB family protein n=1 Tax=Pinibacter aurantiacus TaxID=2851599 RepID=A0A9E2S9T0_9BACT|nr:MgtC/SapB family protein [Pinibacter aurantiacus]MBV4359061.1 MgtC/SapB family protein [Pinibacter aurantiacus]